MINEERRKEVLEILTRCCKGKAEMQEIADLLIDVAENQLGVNDVPEEYYDISLDLSMEITMNESLSENEEMIL